MFFQETVCSALQRQVYRTGFNFIFLSTYYFSSKLKWTPNCKFSIGRYIFIFDVFLEFSLIVFRSMKMMQSI